MSIPESPLHPLKCSQSIKFLYLAYFLVSRSPTSASVEHSDFSWSYLVTVDLLGPLETRNHSLSFQNKQVPLLLVIEGAYGF